MPSIIKISSGSTAGQIQAAIDRAPAGATVQLAAGNYRFDKTVVINRDDISIVGAGSGSTIISVSTGMQGAPAFRIGQALFTEKLTSAVKIASVDEGASAVTVSSGTHSLKAGDAVWIEQANDSALFSEIGDTKWRDDKPLRTALATVKSVDGDKITLDRALPFDFASSGTTLQEIDLATGIKLKGLTLKGAYGDSNPAKFTNGITAEKNGVMLLVNATDGVVIQDVDILQAGSNGMVIGKTIDAQVSDVLVKGAHNKGDGGNGYGIWIRDVYDSEFRDLSVFDTRHAVLFASYTSAVGNFIHVTSTNRDINFHGGLDHDNTVIIDRSVRASAEQSYLGAVAFVNPGTEYGAPTDPDANTILFKKVVGTVREDLVRAFDGGAQISTVGGADTIIGGRGNDSLDAGSGNDRIIASFGTDTIIGGLGDDQVRLAADRDEIVFIKGSAGLGIVGLQGTTWLREVETLVLNDATLRVADLMKSSSAATTQSGRQTFDWADASGSMVMGTNLNAVRLHGNADAIVIGNALANKVVGNTGGNVIVLNGGNDTAVGGVGRDVIAGGGGTDLLRGGDGGDILDGGVGRDKMIGGSDADVFYASGGRNLVMDFQPDQGDTFLFRGATAAQAINALQDWQGGAARINGFGFSIVRAEGMNGLSITDQYGAGLVFLEVTKQQMLDFYL